MLAEEGMLSFDFNRLRIYFYFSKKKTVINSDDEEGKKMTQIVFYFSFSSLRVSSMK